jgi:hypothetical protein
MARSTCLSLMSLVFLAGALVSCGDDGASTGRDPLSLDGLPHFTLVEELRLGDRDDPDLGFSRVGGLAVDDDGLIYVGEAQAREIRVFSREGERLRVIGRPGQGPGEFQGSPRFGVVGDTLWTFDMQGDRITLFRRDGTLLSAHRVEGIGLGLPSGGFAWVLPLQMQSDGRFTSDLLRVTFDPNRRADGVGPAMLRVPRVLFDARGQVVDTLGWDSSPKPRMVPPPGHESSMRMITVGERRLVVPTPPTTLPQWIALDDGRIEIDMPIPPDAHQGAVRVTRFGLAEDTVYCTRLTFTPEPFTQDDLDSIAATAARRPGGGIVFPGAAPPPAGDVAAIQARLRAEMAFPAFRPGALRGRVGEDGAVWLQRYDADPLVQRWIVLDSGGMPRGEVELPHGSRPIWSRADTVWVMEPDEVEVPWVVRYRLDG